MWAWWPSVDCGPANVGVAVTIEAKDGQLRKVDTNPGPYFFDDFKVTVGGVDQDCPNGVSLPSNDRADNLSPRLHGNRRKASSQVLR